MAKMESSQPNRRLAAVMFLDMARYSALMARNEAQALADLKELRKILQPAVAEAGGRILKYLGDGFLIEFPTALAAVSCGKRVLDALNTRNQVRAKREHIYVRAAVQLGDVVEEKGDLFGDAVNIAARLQPLCDPNSMAMTEMVYVQVCNQIVLKGAFTPPRKLKNIPNRMRVFQTAPEGVDLTFWRLKKQGWVAAAAFLLLALGLFSTGALWFKHRLEADRLRAGLLYIQPQNPRSQGIAHAMEEEVNLRFASLKGIRWVERAALLDQFQKAGIEDLGKVKDLETKAHSVAKESELHYALYGWVEKIAKDRWRLTLKVVDTQSMGTVKVFTVSGADAASIVSLMKVKAQGWLRKED